MRCLFAVSALFVFAAAAQAGEQTTTLRVALQNMADEFSLARMAQAFQTIAECEGVTPEATGHSVVLRGTSAQLTLAQWMVEQTDKPAGWKPTVPFVSYEYNAAAGANASATSVRVFYLRNLDSNIDMQEAHNILRMGADLDLIVPLASPRALMVRGTPERVTLAEWVMGQINQPVQADRPTARYEYHPKETGRDQRTGAVRVLYFRHVQTDLGMLELQNMIRTGCDVNRVIPLNSRWAMIIRGEPERVALAEWVVQQIDRKAGDGLTTASYDFQTLDAPPNDYNLYSAVRVIHLRHVWSSLEVMNLQNRIRSEAGIVHFFHSSTQDAFLLRGKAGGVALAEKMIAEADEGGK